MDSLPSQQRGIFLTISFVAQSDTPHPKSDPDVPEWFLYNFPKPDPDVSEWFLYNFPKFCLLKRTLSTAHF
jgi:hypothetical protein